MVYLYTGILLSHESEQNNAIDREMRTKWYTSTLGYYSAMNQNRIMPLTAVWMDRVVTILSKGSQREKDKYHRVSLTVVFLK